MIHLQNSEVFQGVNVVRNLGQVVVVNIEFFEFKRRDALARAGRFSLLIVFINVPENQARVVHIGGHFHRRFWERRRLVRGSKDELWEDIKIISTQVDTRKVGHELNGRGKRAQVVVAQVQQLDAVEVDVHPKVFRQMGQTLSRRNKRRYCTLVARCATLFVAGIKTVILLAVALCHFAEHRGL